MPISAPQVASAEPEILTQIYHHAGVITLNRPKSLNALSLGMIRGIYAALLAWRDDPRVHFVIIEGAGERAFCAGGDIRAVYYAQKTKDPIFPDAIFREEYRMNHLIHTYPKPYIALINGICMGGGLGVSVHGSHRVVTDKTMMAMPETTIGFFPDVGAGYFLNQCPGFLGTWMGVLGEKFNGADALYSGLGTHYIAAENIPMLREKLIQADFSVIKTDEAAAQVDQIIALFPENPPPSELAAIQTEIDHWFSADTVEEIMARLAQTNHSKANHQKAVEYLQLMSKKSPTSLKVSLAALRRARGQNITDILCQEFYLSQHFLEGHDLSEGVRALLIDKDQNPQWFPSALEDIAESHVERYFSPILDRPWSL